MGIPKHGKDSARTKKSKKYKDEGRRETNKLKRAERIVAGKKIKSRKGLKTKDMLADDAIRKIKLKKPIVTSSGLVMWGNPKE